MSAPYLPSKTLHSKEGAPPKCPSNTLVKNLSAVSLCDLLTVDSLLCIGAGMLVAQCAAKLCNATPGSIAHIIIWTLSIVVVLIIWICAHVALGIPSNLTYYFGLGKPPHVFKTCACFPAPSASIASPDTDTSALSNQCSPSEMYKVHRDKSNKYGKKKKASSA